LLDFARLVNRLPCFTPFAHHHQRPHIKPVVFSPRNLDLFGISSLQSPDHQYIRNPQTLKTSKMKPVSVIASILALALTATAVPATLQRRWCYPVCCCGTDCTAGEVCDVEGSGYVTYCCNTFLTTVSLKHSQWCRSAADVFHPGPAVGGSI
jgi:hypothetical protein